MNILVGPINIINNEKDIIATQVHINSGIQTSCSKGLNDGIVIFPKDSHSFNGVASGTVPPGSFQTRLNPSDTTPSKLIIVGCCKYTFIGNGVGITRFDFVIGKRYLSGDILYNLTHIGPRTMSAEIYLGRANIGNTAI